MELRKMHWIGIGFGLAIIIADLILFFFSKDRNLLLFLAGIGVGVIALPFIINIMTEGKKKEEIAERFLEFSRNLAESVATGTPISKSIINMRRKSYGALTPHIEKLANQISVGIPVSRAMQTFADDVNNDVISRAVALISEAERAGGQIEYILDSVANSIAEIEKLKKERQANVSSLVVQGYIIFFIFMGIILVMEFKIIPLTVGAGSIGGMGGAGLGTIGNVAETAITAPTISPEELSKPFLYLLMVQGFFAGLTIGKLSEGSLKAGIKHSFILTIIAYLVYTGANLFF